MLSANITVTNTTFNGQLEQQTSYPGGGGDNS